MHACICMVAYLHVFTNMHMRTCRNLFQNSVAYKSRSREVTAKHAQLSTSCLPARFLNSQCFAVFVGKREARGSGSRRNGVWAELNAWSTTAAGFVILHAVSMIGHQWNEPGSAWLPDASSCWYMFLILLQSFSGIDMIFIQKTGCQERAPGLNPEPAGLH